MIIFVMSSFFGFPDSISNASPKKTNTQAKGLDDDGGADLRRVQVRHEGDLPEVVPRRLGGRLGDPKFDPVEGREEVKSEHAYRPSF